MPRRNPARQQPRPSPPPPPQRLPPPPPQLSDDVLQLRRHWKWAAFSQFFYTFNQLFGTNDITITDIENDLVHSTSVALPRIMQRLLYTVTQDRKVSLDNWQTSLRKQYAKRDPDANPIGPLPSDKSTRATESLRPSEAPVKSSRAPSTTASNHGQLDGSRADDDERPSGRDTSGHPKAEDQETSMDQPSKDIKDEDTSQIADQTNVDADADEAVPEEDEDEEETLVDWLTLPMMVKLESMHIVMEWHFQNPYRLRSLMKDDDETAQWRIEPIGYDSKRNAYWLIGADRLWIQREPPRANHKRKRPTKKDGSSKGKSSQQANIARPSKRARLESSSAAPVASTSTPSRPTRRSAQTSAPASPSTPTGRSSRAAKARANQKLDAQAKDLAEYQRLVRSQAHAKAQPASPSKSNHPTGTRMSARLRGSSGDVEWQEVPKEWLDDGGSGVKGNNTSSLRNEIKKLKTGLESDDDSASELTDLSDLSEDGGENSEQVSRSEEKGERDEDTEAGAEPKEAGFVEWETICVTLEEWEHVADRFAKAAHYSEKALYKVLTQVIVPAVTSDLREINQRRRMDEAVSHRKRSARIAFKESEKEEEQRKVQQRAEEEEKLSRTRRLEARIKKEEEERQRKENAREQRRREREEREENRARLTEEAAKSRQTGKEKGSGPSQSPAASVLTNGVSSKAESGTRTPGEDWELDCEICQRRGMNQDDNTPLMCCGSCSRWQHIICHDRRDAHAGRPRRDWDKEDFVCEKCRQSRLAKAASLHPSIAGMGDAYAYRGAPPRVNHNAVPSYNHYQAPVGNGHAIPSMAASLRGSLYSPGGSAHQTPVYHNQPGVTFAHYQPQQGGFSTSRPSYAAQDPNHAQPYYPQTQGPSRPTQYPSYTEKWHTASYPRPGASYGAPFVQTYPHNAYGHYGDQSSHVARAPQSDVRSNGNQAAAHQYPPYDYNR
ncbi:hypothetical protein CONPUDRAFT_163372 [Coniophora puteana RWD-64-598 SS2]|uniref:PHD-type domain-containing protein n=1 Tax=Coniophora puteana (strain RWD-64-598) TaxID=741705 RepID=A0A5M3MYD7_CONPW|nr:uncharacterized protein CONPUDRAFT_163372 [Coniophora puteana RWD-64-598 SS2]EIW84183.1 hypothetical protein CONPUDRAFT_163372 [Coniophora puteana RWD-64-598 SS2]